jgi:hypothetical protein
MTEELKGTGLQTDLIGHAGLGGEAEGAVLGGG